MDNLCSVGAGDCDGLDFVAGVDLNDVTPADTPGPPEPINLLNTFTGNHDSPGKGFEFHESQADDNDANPQIQWLAGSVHQSFDRAPGRDCEGDYPCREREPVRGELDPSVAEHLCGSSVFIAL